jgi:hypothetical protein
MQDQAKQWLLISAFILAAQGTLLLIFSVFLINEWNVEKAAIIGSMCSLFYYGAHSNVSKAKSLK